MPRAQTQGFNNDGARLKAPGAARDRTERDRKRLSDCLAAAPCGPTPGRSGRRWGGMVSFSIAPSSKFHSHSIGRWRTDSDLHAVMPWVRLGGHHIDTAKLSFRFLRMRELWVGVTVTSSSLTYQNVPTPQRAVGEHRIYTLLMPNKPRLVHVGGHRYLQQSNECVLTDSDDAVVGAYADPHAAICLNIPCETVNAWLPSSAPLNTLRLGTTSTSSRTIS